MFKNKSLFIEITRISSLCYPIKQVSKRTSFTSRMSKKGNGNQFQQCSHQMKNSGNVDKEYFVKSSFKAIVPPYSFFFFSKKNLPFNNWIAKEKRT